MAYDDDIELKDPAGEKMIEQFKKLTMHQFWKQVKKSVKENAVEKEELADFKKLYKSFNMGLGKALDKFDEAFPDLGKMKKTSPEVERILKDYDNKIEDTPGLQKASMLLSGAVKKLQVELKRRIAWVQKYVK